MRAGYEVAIGTALQQLRELPPDEVCKRTGASYNGFDYILPWLGRVCALGECSGSRKILMLHYLTSPGTSGLRGAMMSYRESPNGLFYASAFEQRAVRPLVKAFGECPKLLHAAGERLGGQRYAAGDAAVTLPLLPHVPVTYVVWRGDAELAASGAVLFDKSAAAWFCAEDLAVAGSLGAYALVGAKTE